MPQSFQQLAMRCATCLILFSDPVVPSASGTPALRKYFCARMSVATCDQAAGTSTSFISKTASPDGLRITDERFSYLKRSKTLTPSLLKYLSTFNPLLLDADVFFVILFFMADEICVNPVLKKLLRGFLLKFIIPSNSILFRVFNTCRGKWLHYALVFLIWWFTRNWGC